MIEIRYHRTRKKKIYQIKNKPRGDNLEVTVLDSEGYILQEYELHPYDIVDLLEAYERDEEMSCETGNEN